MKSFFLGYKSFSMIVSVFILFDFFRSCIFEFDSIRSLSLFGILGSAIRIPLTVLFLSLFFYRIYEFIFLDVKLYIKAPLVLSGTFVIIFQVVNLFIRSYYLLPLLINIFLIVLYVLFFVFLIKKASNENYKGISVIAFVMTLAMSLLTIVYYIKSVLAFPFLTGIFGYLYNVSIYSLIALMIYVSLSSFNNVKIFHLPNTVSKACILIFCALLTFFVYMLKNENILENLFTGFGMQMILPSYTYFFVAALFCISFLRMIILWKSEHVFYLAVSFFMMSSFLSSSINQYLLKYIYISFWSLFALTEMFITGIAVILEDKKYAI